MVKNFLSLIAILLLQGIAFGQSVQIDEKVTTKEGRIATVTIKSDGKATNWTIVPNQNIDIFREYDPDPTVIKLRLLSYEKGVYYVVASTTLNDKIDTKTCVVTIGEGAPKPPPDNPVDTDAQLVKNLKAVFAADSSPDKDTELDALIALYDQGSIFVKTRADLKTYGQVWAAFGDVAKTLGCSKKLIAVQQIIQNEMALAGIPLNPADGATAVDKDKLVPQLQRTAALLKRIK